MFKQRLVFTKNALDLLMETSESEGVKLSLVYDDARNVFVKIHNTRQYFYLDRINTQPINQNDVIFDINQMNCNTDKPLYKRSLRMKTDDSKGEYFPNDDQDDEMKEDDRYVPEPYPKRMPNIRYNRYNRVRHIQKMRQKSSKQK